jgi:hypothetical protein
MRGDLEPDFRRRVSPGEKVEEAGGETSRTKPKLLQLTARLIRFV